MLPSIALAPNPGAPAALALATTYCGGTSSVAGVHVLSESLIRAGHREGLTVFMSARPIDDELHALRAVPLVKVVSAPPLSVYYASGRSEPSKCCHLRLALFGSPMLTPRANVVHLTGDSVELSIVEELADAAPFSAVRATHADGFALDTVVLRRDDAVAQTLQNAFCAGDRNDADVPRTAVPPGYGARWTTNSECRRSSLTLHGTRRRGPNRNCDF